MPETSKYKKYFTLLSLYLAQSIPMAFFSTVVPLIMRQESFSLTSIGMLQMLKLPWIFKFLWAPLIDEKGNNIGSLRKIIIRSELFYAVVIFIIALLGIKTNFILVLVFMLISFFVSATQDIAVDRFAILILREEEQSMGNSMQSSGSFLGSLIGTGLLLMLYHYIGWTAVLGFIVAFVLIGLVPLRTLTIDTTFSSDLKTKQKVSFHDIISFFSQPGAIRLVLLLLFSYSGLTGLLTMIKPMMIDFGYSILEISYIMGVGGSAVATIMAMTSGWIIRRVGLSTSICFYAALSMLSALFLAIFIKPDSSYLQILLGVLSPWACYGAMSVSIYTLGMKNVRPKREGTDFTIMIVLTHLGSIVVAGLSGLISQRLGYNNFFFVEAILSLITICFLVFNTRLWGK